MFNPLNPNAMTPEQMRAQMLMRGGLAMLAGSGQGNNNASVIGQGLLSGLNQTDQMMQQAIKHKMMKDEFDMRQKKFDMDKQTHEANLKAKEAYHKASEKAGNILSGDFPYFMPEAATYNNAPMHERVLGAMQTMAPHHPSLFNQMLPKPPKAGTERERALKTYGKLFRKMEQGTLSKDEEIEYGNAIAILQREQLRLDPQGNITSYVPELPQYGPQPKKSRATILGESGKVKADKNKLQRVRKLTSEIRSMVKEGKNTSWYNKPTGPAAWATSNLQGLRDIGIPIPRAGFETSKRIEEIAFLMTPYITGEKGKGISDYDRKRIEKLLGGMSPVSFDADAILSAMDIIESYGDRLEDETYSKSKGAGPESLKEGEQGEFNGKRYRMVNGQLQVWED